ISVEMTEEEMEIAASTPRYRFDVQASSTPDPAAAKPDEATTGAADFVEEVVASKEQPVVLFALEWCEFSWSLRKMFAEMDIPYRSVDLDSVDYQKDNWGGDIRAALRERIATPTIPQVFVGGEHIGGCTETLDAFNDGRLQDLLTRSGVAFSPKAVDAYSYLPKWVHPR
ncbi:MAG: O-acetylserine lyase, partial [Bauldia sp.]|nr:O-acetylserine lyase [Bauldia sp.]